MQHRRVRTDQFSSEDTLLRVTGRQGYEESTDVWIQRDVEVEFAQNTPRTIDPGFNVLNDQYDLRPFTRINLNGVVDCKIAQGSICNSLENVKIKPVGCTSFYDAYPKTQQKILPYLVPAGTRERYSFQHDGTATFDETSEVGDPAEYKWDPRVNGNFIISTHANATVQGDQDSLEEKGFCPGDLVQFGTVPAEDDTAGFAPFDAASPYLLPVDYSAKSDELTWNKGARNVVVRIDSKVLDHAANVGAAYHYFLLTPGDTDIDANCSWSAVFDINGIAGRGNYHGQRPPVVTAIPAEARPDPTVPVAFANAGEAADYENLVLAWEQYDDYVSNKDAFDEAERLFGLKNGKAYPDNNTTYRYSATQFNEFWEIHLWDNANTNKFIANNNTPIPAAHVLHGLVRLFLRRPKFSKGVANNWEAHPGLARFYSWYDKEVDPTGPLVHQKVGANLFPTGFAQLQQPNNSIRQVIIGDVAVRWRGLDLGNVGANTHRVADRWIFTLEDDPEIVALYERLSALGDVSETVITLGAHPGGHIQARPFVAGVPNNVNVQHPDDRDYLVQFKRRHARFPGGRVITLDRDGANGCWFPNAGPAAFTHGVPHIHTTFSLLPRAAGQQGGQQIPPITGWINTPVPGLPLIHPVTPNAQFPFNSNVTEVPNNWLEGGRPMFTTDANYAENFTYHPKVNNADPDVIPGGGQSLDSVK